MAKTSTNSTNSTPSTPSVATEIPSAAASAATVPNPSPTVKNEGKINPLTAVMRAVNGIPIGQSELVLLIEFLKPDSTVRLTDTHILQAASGLVKKCHIGYTQLALKVAGQLAFEAKAGIPQFRSEIELTTGVGFANRNDAESYIVDGRKQSVYSDEYQLYTMKQIKDAGSYLWDAYGKTGTINPGLIDRANARARVEIDAARSARA